MLRHIAKSFRQADYGVLLLELSVLIFGILLALAVDRLNQDRLDRIETTQIIERLKSDTTRNLAKFEREMPLMESNLSNVKALFRALEAGTMAGENSTHIELAIAFIDVIPSHPLIFAGYDELVATGRLRQLDDPVLVDMLGNQRALYEAANAVVGYWRDLIQGATNALDQKVDFYYTTQDMKEGGMGVRFDFADLAGDRNLKNKVFDAVDIHYDWLETQSRIYEVTKQINTRLNTL